jgi:hypothetical protein
MNARTRAARARRRGMSAVEVVMTAGIAFPTAALFYYLGTSACDGLFHVITTLVNWPYM